MSETNDSARRWSGYVCPDCRLVFRVPRDHDGQGVVCQNCRRLLRIPAAGDPTPALAMESISAPTAGPSVTAALPEPAPESVTGESVSPRLKRRERKRRSGSGAAADRPSWEHSGSASSRSAGHDPRAMRWMLGGGILLLGLIAGGLMVALRGGGKAGGESPPASQITQSPVAALDAVAEPDMKTLLTRSVPSILAEAEPLARKFLEATTVEELLPLLRNPDRVKPRLMRAYPQGRLEAPGLAQFNVGGDLAVSESIAVVKLLTNNFASRQLTFVQTPEGLKIDWECWAGWSDMTWPEFLAALPVAATTFRVIVRRVDYYNFGFSDDKKWQSYRLESPDGEHLIFGYVQRDSIVERQIRLGPDVDHAPMILKISFPAGVAASNNQVVVNDVIANGWIEPDE